MDATLYLPPNEKIPQAGKEEIQKLLTEQDFRHEWDEAPAALEDREGTAPFFSRIAEGETENAWTELAQKNGLSVAIHIDGTHADDTYEWDHKSYIRWFNAKTGRIQETCAGSLTSAPQLDLGTLQEILSDEGKLREWEEDFLCLKTLGAIKDELQAEKTRVLLKEFNPESGEFSDACRPVDISVDNEGIRITLGRKKEEISEGSPDLFIEATETGWRAFAHEDSNSEPSAKILIPDGKEPVAQACE